ncbi:MAG: ELWxxDGT repeat protein [Myxococcota bacterium]
MKDIHTGSTPVGSAPGEFVTIGSTTFFVASTPSTSFELWKTDGTASGTELVKDVWPGTRSSLVVPGVPGRGSLTNLNGTLIFVATTPPTGTELWKTDGTEAGTVLLKDINPGPDWSVPTELTVANGRLFFIANDGTSGVEL